MASHALHHGFVVGVSETSGLPNARDGYLARVHREHRAAVAVEE